MIAAEGLEFFWLSCLNTPVVQALCKETSLHTQDKTGMESGLLHSMLSAPLKKNVNRWCSPARTEVTFNTCPIPFSNSCNLWSSVLGQCPSWPPQMFRSGLPERKEGYSNQERVSSCPRAARRKHSVRAWNLSIYTRQVPTAMHKHGIQLKYEQSHL